MATNNLGRVAFVLKGAYSEVTAYKRLDVVTYLGNSYAAKGDTTGNLPTNETYWQLIASKGDAGEQGADGVAGAYFNIDVQGLASALSTYDAELVPFIYYATDTGDLYIKQSNTSGDWSDPIAFKGVQGDQGTAGSSDGSYEQVDNATFGTGTEETLGAELSGNVTFDDATWWNVTAGVLSSVAGAGRVTASAAAGYQMPRLSRAVFTIGTNYRISGKVRSNGVETPKVMFVGAGSYLFTGTTSTDWQPFSVDVAASNSTIMFFFSITDPTGTEYVEWDDISMKEIIQGQSQNLGTLLLSSNSFMNIEEVMNGTTFTVDLDETTLTAGRTNEFALLFTTGATAPTVTLPSTGVLWDTTDGLPFAVPVANTTYIYSFLYISASLIIASQKIL